MNQKDRPYGYEKKELLNNVAESRQKSNQERVIELECLRLASDGAGIGYHEGKATFVLGLLPGEYGQVQIFEEKKNWQRGKLLSIHKGTESIHRVEAPCTVFGICGGCQIQHLSYEETLLWKQRWVKDALSRIGKIDIDKVNIYPTIGMEEPWRYRNKARIHCGEDNKLGYYQEKSNLTVRFDDCLLISEPTNCWIKELEGILHKEVPEVKTLTFRENSRGEGMLILDPVYDPASVREILGRMVWANGFKQGIRPSGDDVWLEDNKYKSEESKTGKGREEGQERIFSVWGINTQGKPHLLGGDAEFTEEILGLEFNISPLAFLQVNPIQTRKLYSQVLQWADLLPEKVIWDLYSGIGTITLALARNAKKVWGIEENPYAVEDAKVNAEHNQIGNVEFIAGKVEDTFQQIPEHPDVVVLDPPRAGAHHKVLEGLIGLQPKRIVYVSCDPGTLARDLGILQNGGYQVREVQPVDMFPWTVHVECVTLMSRVKD